MTERATVRPMIRPVRDDQHGTLTGYNYGCRCAPCKEARRVYAKARGFKAPKTPMQERHHGTAMGYGNYKCRCDKCRAWSARKGRERLEALHARGTNAYETQIKPRIEHYRAHPELIPDYAHGTQGGYTNYGCRCTDCQAAWAKAVEEAKERRASRPVPEHVHGTQNGYGNYKCRCRPCTDAWSKATVERTRRRKARG